MVPSLGPSDACDDVSVLNNETAVTTKENSGKQNTGGEDRSGVCLDYVRIELKIRFDIYLGSRDIYLAWLQTENL